MTEQYFHFTLGPVQSFVSQARRTRDFWAGSFLLSWLSSVAMLAVIKQGGKIIFPQENPNYLNWLENKGTGQPPRQGCVPNRFKGSHATVPEDFKPELVEQSIRSAWQALAARVWQQDLADCPPATRIIWERQVTGFWEISWALTDNIDESNLLDRRKNWRNHLPSAEPGVKCMGMDGWQELSGINTPNAEGLKRFWNDLRQSGATAIQTDLREHEYLCAIAFIKRRFAHCFADLVAPMPGGWTLYGWQVSAAVPSVAYMAAAPWLAQVLKQAPEPELKTFHDEAKKLTLQYGEYDTRLDCIDQALTQRNDARLFWKTKSLDGNVFFEAALANKNIYQDQKQAGRVIAALKALRQAITLEPVSPFYAVLMMDGDRLGSFMSDRNNHQKISEGLHTFTTGVAAIVKEHSGFLIYAGGDDVLALLPLESALNCANQLRLHYLRSFKDSQIATTLSGAIEYAHIRMPLGKVLSDAHRLLDDIAKTQTGRDAIAVRVWKPGGQHLQWAMPWEKAIDKPTGEVVINRLADDFKNDQQVSQFSNSFFFNVESRFAGLQSKNEQGEISLPVGFSVETLQKLIVAEYLNSGVNRGKTTITLNEAEKRVKDLLSQCFVIRRTPENQYTETGQLNTHAMQLIRFLAQKGVDHG